MCKASVKAHTNKYDRQSKSGKHEIAENKSFGNDITVKAKVNAQMKATITVDKYISLRSKNTKTKSTERTPVTIRIIILAPKLRFTIRCARMIVVKK